MGPLVIVERYLNRPYDSLPPKDHRRAKTTTKVWLEMADGANIPPIEQDRRADAGDDGADSKRRPSFGLYNAFRPMFALICKLVVVESISRK
jgi:hypothetical protein